MIPQETIDKIFDEARIDEVVGDFVVLKKRGVNLLGNCPFHNEKTPSFTVSPAKGIYKCFGCGKAGNSVNFVMDHEQFTYPDALRYLAKKYSIEIVEEKVSDEEQAKQNERETQYLIHQFASEWFTENLKTDEGKAIGASYYKERGLSIDSIKTFNLGYSVEARDGFAKAALAKGYDQKALVDSGIIIEKNGRVFDRFSGRVMFPIHNLTGRVIGFGGRTLSSEKKIAKYLNSPETIIYSKSKVLYGIFQAKKSIIQNDNCFLVEGYTDVISFHQSGVENVVASSGTSLTTDQIRLIKRFTNSITVLFDGDTAGLKAAFRGIDMILEQDLNVKVVAFDEGEDPDSYAQSHTPDQLKEFLSSQSHDFITFKCKILLDEAAGDPIKKAELIKDIVESIAKIPDMIKRSVFVKETSRLLEIEEQTLLNELNKIRRTELSKTKRKPPNQHGSYFEQVPPPPSEEYFDPTIPPEFQEQEKPKEKKSAEISLKEQEREIIRILLQYGHLEIRVDKVNRTDEDTEPVYLSLAQLVIEEIEEDDLKIEDETLRFVFNEFKRMLHEEEEIPTEKYFLQSQDTNVVSKVMELLDMKYELSNWEHHNIFVNTEEDNLKTAVMNNVNRFKLAKVESLIDDLTGKLKDQESEDEIKKLMTFIEVRRRISKALGRT